jgi:hypothetical protein
MNRIAGGLPGQYPLKRISNYNWGVSKPNRTMAAGGKERSLPFKCPLKSPFCVPPEKTLLIAVLPVLESGFLAAGPEFFAPARI